MLARLFCCRASFIPTCVSCFALDDSLSAPVSPARLGVHAVRTLYPFNATSRRELSRRTSEQHPPESASLPQPQPKNSMNRLTGQKLTARELSDCRLSRWQKLTAREAERLQTLALTAREAERLQTLACRSLTAVTAGRRQSAFGMHQPGQANSTKVLVNHGVQARRCTHVRPRAACQPDRLVREKVRLWHHIRCRPPGRARN